MPEWNTTLSHDFRRPEFAKTGLEMIYGAAKIAKVPIQATWSVSIRGFGILIFATWEREPIKEEEWKKT